MKNEKILPLIKGSIKLLPFVKSFLSQKTGGTIESRYCYSVWMRHLKYWSQIKSVLPNVIAELGPGDSCGIGFAALLSGCEKFNAFDVVNYWDTERNLKIFDELVILFKHRSDIPNNNEYPLIFPVMDNYKFPFDLISETQLEKSLSKERIELIRNEILNIENPNNKFINFQIPWYDQSVLDKNSVDFIYSQAVLEHVEDLENTYQAMSSWLKPLGLMSHSIDFKSHNTINTWNGHWTYSNLEWKIVKGGRDFLINRQPFSYHINLHAKFGFKILEKSFVNMENNLSKKQLSKRFRTLTEEDLTTSVMYILSQKK